MLEGSSIFAEESKDPNCRARTGLISLPHGPVATPCFMPVGTQATVKAMSNEDLEAIGFPIILANSYHLALRPGGAVIERAGGIHGFSKWSKNILTDSGGFQVFSLAKMRKITDEGVRFQSHHDGSRHFFTPENVVDLQVQFNSDIQMQLDVCSGYGASAKEVSNALKLTSAWAARAKKQWLQAREQGYQGKLFPIIQGGFDKALRQRSAEEILALDLPGIAIGGLSVGEPYELYAELLAHTCTFLPENKPRYVMGIGTPHYIFTAVENGIDIFDCVLPTRTARTGLLFTHSGPITIKKVLYKEDFLPIDPQCTCPVCKCHSRAYIHQLFRTQEILYAMLATRHNLYFLWDMMQKIQEAIRAGNFLQFKNEFLKMYSGGNDAV